MPNLTVLLAVTCQMQIGCSTMPEWINCLVSHKNIVSIYQGSDQLPGSSSVYPAVPGSTHQVSTVSLITQEICATFWLLC